ncbi:MAG: acyltransferase [Candidatus Brocadiae bacterium]|nr:acyltransferase [Candidatus Brocadiia bacterium]
MRVGFVQFAPELGRSQPNLERAEALAPRADLLVLPELAASGYNFESTAQARSLSEPADGPTLAACRRIARKTGAAAVVAGFAERDGDRLYNSALLADAGGLLGVYRKTHVFESEKDHFLPGDTGFRVWDVAGVRVGVMVCFDWFFPEAARTLALRGAEIIAHPSNLVLPWCPDSMPVRSLENAVFAVTCNRWGEERGLKFIGRSQVTAPDGQILVRAPDGADAAETVEIDPARARVKTIAKRNDRFGDRRPEHYAR